MAPPTGQPLRYRLVSESAGRRVSFGEISVRVPADPAWSLAIRDDGRSTGAWRAIVTMPVAGEVSMTMVDAQGRRWLTLGPRALSPGQHEIPLDSSGTIPAGVYWVRMRSGADTRVARTVHQR